MASACFQELIVELTDAKRDQDHLETICINCPGIPDRTDYILGRSGEDPSVEIIKIARQLESFGVQAIAVPCVTSAYFRKELQAAVNVPVLYGLEKTARDLRSRGITRAGIMATEGSLKTGIIRDALAEYGIESVIPTEEDQQKTMDLIYKYVKSGCEDNVRLFDEVRRNLTEQGAQTVILGCTELSVINMRQHLKGDLTDILRSLAEESITFCGKRVKRSSSLYAAAKCS